MRAWEPEFIQLWQAGATIDVIAAAQGIGVGTVKSRAHTLRGEGKIAPRRRGGRRTRGGESPGNPPAADGHEDGHVHEKPPAPAPPDSTPSPGSSSSCCNRTTPYSLGSAPRLRPSPVHVFVHVHLKTSRHSPPSRGPPGRCASAPRSGPRSSRRRPGADNPTTTSWKWPYGPISRVSMGRFPRIWLSYRLDVHVYVFFGDVRTFRVVEDE